MPASWNSLNDNNEFQQQPCLNHLPSTAFRHETMGYLGNASPLPLMYGQRDECSHHCMVQAKPSQAKSSFRSVALKPLAGPEATHLCPRWPPDSQKPISTCNITFLHGHDQFQALVDSFYTFQVWSKTAAGLVSIIKQNKSWTTCF